MSVLSPNEAINAAVGVYGLQGGKLNPEAAFFKYKSVTNRFEFKDTEAFNSKTGAFIKLVLRRFV